MNRIVIAPFAFAAMLALPAVAADKAPATSPSLGTNAAAIGMRTLDPSMLREVDDDEPLRAANMSVDQLQDMKIVNADGDKIGEVDEVLADTNNVIVAVTVETDGFLGMGEREIIIGMGQLQVEGGKLVSTMSSEELKGLPEWKENRKR